MLARQRGSSTVRLVKKPPEQQQQEEEEESPLRFFAWHRPLGAAPTCRRLTMWTTTVRRGTSPVAVWAVPQSLPSVLQTIRHEHHDNNNNNNIILDTLELDGCDHGEAIMDDGPWWWPQICQAIRRRRPLRRVVFYGNGPTDLQRVTLLTVLQPRVVELQGCHGEATLDWLLSPQQQTVQELRLYHCAPLTTAQADGLTSWLSSSSSSSCHCSTRRVPLLRALVLHHTPWPGTLQRLYQAVEQDEALEEFAVVGASKDNHDDDNDDDDNDTQQYLRVLTQLNRMRRYYYYSHRRHQLRKLCIKASSSNYYHCCFSSFGVADDALAVVQSWWRATHRPATLGGVSSATSGTTTSLASNVAAKANVVTRGASSPDPC